MAWLYNLSATPALDQDCRIWCEFASFHSSPWRLQFDFGIAEALHSATLPTDGFPKNEATRDTCIQGPTMKLFCRHGPRKTGFHRDWRPSMAITDLSKDRIHETRFLPSAFVSWKNGPSQIGENFRLRSLHGDCQMPSLHCLERESKFCQWAFAADSARDYCPKQSQIAML